MASEALKADSRFYFESFGVSVQIESNNEELLQEARSKIEETFVDNFRIVGPVETRHTYRLDRDGTTYVLVKDGQAIRFGESKMAFLRSFDTFVRLAVAEFAIDVVFIHAGVVG